MGLTTSEIKNFAPAVYLHSHNLQVPRQLPRKNLSLLPVLSIIPFVHIRPTPYPTKLIDL